MRIAISIIAALAFCPAVWAAPVTLKQATNELAKRGAESIQFALLMGTPHIQAHLDGQGMILRLTECEKDTMMCQVATFSSCREYISMTEKQAMTIANNYSKQEQSRGSAHVADAPLLGQKLCVRLRADLHTEDVFDLSDVFDWQLTMRDFFEFTDAAIDASKVRDLASLR